MSAGQIDGGASASTLSTGEDRLAYPYAIAIVGDDGSAVHLHFDHKGTAELYASLLDADKVTRYVAVDEPLAEGDNGWRAVSAFLI